MENNPTEGLLGNTTLEPVVLAKQGLLSPDLGTDIESELGILRTEHCLDERAPEGPTTDAGHRTRQVQEE